MKALLEALPRLARDAAVGVIVPAWWGREQLNMGATIRIGLWPARRRDERPIWVTKR
jgi:hypothetical protein